MQRRRRVSITAVAGGVVISIVLVAMTLASPSPVPWEHYTCVRGTQLASEYNWTPEEISNSPFGGWGNATFGVTPGGGGGGPNHNGAATMFFGMDEWNLSMVNRVLVSGLGPSESCPTYEIDSYPNLPAWQQSGGCGGCTVLGPGNTSDASEPSQFNISIWGGPGSVGATSVIFHNGFVLPNEPSVSTCGGPAQQHNMTSTMLTFQVPFSTPHGELTFNESVYTSDTQAPIPSGSYWEDFAYWFPSNFGMWQIDNLSAPGGPGGGWAFSYSPCQ
jgi:hypothetical protein